MADDFILLTDPKETREFTSRIAKDFFDALEECMKTGDVADKSIYKIIGPPPKFPYSPNPETQKILHERRLLYYTKLLNTKQRIKTMAKV